MMLSQLLCMLLLPLDVFVVSWNTDSSTGVQKDVALTTTDSNGVLMLYYILCVAPPHHDILHSFPHVNVPMSLQ